MCGIFGYIQGLEPEHENAVGTVHQGLRRLVYRGYDSWGYATGEGRVEKSVGEVTETLQVGVQADSVIGHTRWATHGEVNEENAHPHESCGEEPRFSVVHNGVIDNYEEIKQALLNENHEFTSETDTEVIPHFIEAQVEKGRTTAEALNVFDEEAQGNYAIVLMDRKEEQLYGLKRGSPLVFAYPTVEDGVMEHPKGAYFASDLYAISDKCGEAYFMEDGDIIMTSGSNLALMEEGEWKQGFKNSNWKSFEWTEEEPVLGDDNRYWMEKEIKEIPEALERLEQSMVNEQYDDWKEIVARINDADQVIFTASGTSYHATLLGVYYLKQAGIDAQTIIASEFENYERITDDTVVIAVSQSGETRDVLDAISVARDKDAEVLSLVNVPHSTIQRESDLSLEVKAQQEICVAATKTFANQVYALMMLAGEEPGQDLAEKLADSIEEISFVALEDAHEFQDQGHEDIYIIGNASTYPVAREIALKIKEISYVHAEGMMAGELKHGTLALIEEGTPVIALDDGTGSITTNIEEVEARGARTKTLVNDEGDEAEFIFSSTIYGFFLALHWAHLKGLPVDRPRNLAKSVTVK